MKLRKCASLLSIIGIPLAVSTTAATADSHTYYPNNLQIAIEMSMKQEVHISAYGQIKTNRPICKNDISGDYIRINKVNKK